MCANKLRLNPEKTKFIVISSTSNAKRITTDSLELQGERISAVSVVRNLGVPIDCALTLHFHIAYVQRTYYYYMNYIRKIRKYLTKQVAKSIVHALVIARIYYCNSLYVNLSNNYHQLSSNKNEISSAHYLTTTHKCKHNWSVQESIVVVLYARRAQFKVLTLVYKSLHDQIPIYTVWTSPPISAIKGTAVYKFQPSGCWKVQSQVWRTGF